MCVRLCVCICLHAARSREAWAGWGAVRCTVWANVANTHTHTCYNMRPTHSRECASFRSHEYDFAFLLLIGHKCFSIRLAFTRLRVLKMPQINLCPPFPFLSPPFLFLPLPSYFLPPYFLSPSSFLFCVCGAGKANSQVLLLLITLSSALCSLPWLCTHCPNPA